MKWTSPLIRSCVFSLFLKVRSFLKKIGKYVQPAAGFNVIANANTKGKGSDDGRFIGTNVLNEAFLERFALTFEQEYPTPAIESKILVRVAASVGKHDEEFCTNLANWADIIRKTLKMEVLMRLFPPVVLFILFVPMLFGAIV